MLQSVRVGEQSIRSYTGSAGEEAIEGLRALAAPLRGARILHLNATPYGGGVAEILRSEIPLLRDLGVAADWKLITGGEHFFRVTKHLHNALQGADEPLDDAEREAYMRHSEASARLLDEHYDVVVVHDPQPLALPSLRGRGGSRWLWRCHIDTSEPQPGAWGFLRPMLEPYDAAVFTMADFVPPDVPVRRIEIVPPAIDPESPKNYDLDVGLAQRVLEWLGVDVHRPLITQVSRFDPWKDPLGVIEAYRLVREEVPGLQLVLAGSMASDDPQGWEVYNSILAAAEGQPDIYVFTNLSGVGNVEVNALQRLSDVVVQKSLREGFGLVVSETLWKRTPVVAGRAGGIPMQLPEGVGGFLVDSVPECAAATLRLLRDQELAITLARRGRRLVRQHYLLTRLIADELRIYGSLLGLTAAALEPAVALAASAPAGGHPAR